MKSMKSVKAFLFCVAAILTVLFAVAISKPYNNVSTSSDSAADKTYDVSTDLTEGTAISYDSTDLSEEEQSEFEDDTTVSVTENESNKTVSVQEDVVTTQAKPSATQSQESTTKIKTATTTTMPMTTAPRETKKQNVSQTQKETTTKKPTVPVTTPSDDREQMTVYYTKTGKRYHYENPCGKGTYYPTTLAEAKKMGLTPCKKCVLH